MGAVCGSSESVSEEVTRPLKSERHRSLILVIQILRHDMREIFGMEVIDQWGFFMDMQLSREIVAFFAFYPKGDRDLYYARMALITRNSDLFIVNRNSIKKIGMWDLQIREDFRDKVGGIVCLAHRSPDLAVGAESGKVYVLNDRTGDTTHTLEGHKRKVRSVAFNEEGSLLVSGSRDDTIRVWCARTWKSLRVLEGHTRDVTRVVFINDYVVSGSVDSSLRVWDSHTGVEQWKMQGRLIKSGVQHLSVNSDHSLVACMHGSLVVFQWTEMSVVCRIPVCSVVCFHPTHPDILAVGGHYGNEHIRFYHARKGTILASFEKYSQRISGITFTKDGSRMVSVAEDRCLRVWDVSHVICD